MAGVHPKENIAEMINRIVPILNENNVDYWLARGAFWSFFVLDRIGDKGDLDFHIWSKDKDMVMSLLGPYVGDFDCEVKDYKFAYSKPDYHFEFMLLNDFPEDDQICFHSRMDGPRYMPKKCFDGYDEYEFEGIKIKTPRCPEKYFSCIYGPNWEKNPDKHFKDSLTTAKENCERS